MSILREFIELVEAGELSSLNSVIAEWLIEEFATKGHGRPHVVMTSLAGIAKTRKHRQVGDINVDWGVINAAYSQDDRTIYVNSDSRGDFRQKVIDVLHEIAHFNQQTLWESDPTFRKSFTKGTIPHPDVADDPPYLYEIPWKEMTRFWLRRYTYQRAPHEVDARRFADQHVDEALELIRMAQEQLDQDMLP